MRYLLILFIFFSFSASAQLRLYAERRNVDNTIDSFFTKLIKDSVFNKQGVYVCPTVESFEGQFEPTYPNGFGSFFKCADGVYRNRTYPYNTHILGINAGAGANLVLTNQANSEQGLANSSRSVVRVNASGFTEARLTAVIMIQSASANTPRIYFQYSTDGVNWIGNGAGISLFGTGAKETVWTTLPEGAKADVYVRVAQNGGDGAADPALGNVTIQFR